MHDGRVGCAEGKFEVGGVRSTRIAEEGEIREDWATKFWMGCWASKFGWGCWATNGEKEDGHVLNVGMVGASRERERGVRER